MASTDHAIAPRPSPEHAPADPFRLPRGVMREAVIDLDALGHNVRLMSRQSAPASLMAVVKANGYGHGMEAVARAVVRQGAQWLGVASMAEALALRGSGITTPIVMWLHAPGEDLAPALAAGIDVSLSSTGSLLALARTARETGVVAQVHLKVDTGLSRNGATPQEWPALVVAAAGLERDGWLRVRGVWSHLGSAEMPGDPRSPAQLRVFRWAVDEARAAGLSPEVVHLADSAAALSLPETRFDLVRSGIALYGVEPLAGGSSGLVPVLTLQASVALTKRVAAGTEASYGHHWKAAKDTTLALIPIGFADGVPRRSWREAFILINGVRCPIAGPIAMDQFVVDVGDLPVRAGDRAVIFGSGRQGEATALQWAGWADTVASEILCRVSARVPRRYISAGQ